MVINTNVAALYANRQLSFNETDSVKTMEKLASGKRINKAGDDASGLAVSEKMISQYRGLQQATRNAQSGISFIQTTEGYLEETQSIMQRVRELAIQAANGIYSDSDRALIQVEISQLVSEVDRIASHAEFNKMNLLTGRFAAGGPVPMNFQVGANMDQRINVSIGTMTSAALNLSDGQNASISISTTDAANMSIGRIDEGLQRLSTQRADLGAYQNRLEHLVRGLEIASENTIASESIIRDTDMASAMVDFSRDQILQQSAVAMLATANTRNQAVLRLLG